MIFSIHNCPEIRMLLTIYILSKLIATWLTQFYVITIPDSFFLLILYNLHNLNFTIEFKLWKGAKMRQYFQLFTYKFKLWKS